MHDKRRSKQEIYMDILRVLLFNQLKMKYTPLMQKSNLANLKLKNEYLPELMKQGLVSKISGKYYKITNKGIDKYIQLKVGNDLMKVSRNL